VDNVLQRAAQRGVRIFVIIYKEAFVLFQDTKYVKKKLQALHPNIRVLRHPKKLLFLWSHHEKIVVVDECIGFLGGIDICYGRYDDHEHALVDKPGKETMFPYLDYQKQ
jgi:phospholipase D1/2